MFPALGTWWLDPTLYPNNNYLSPVQYLNCGGNLQSALTHTDRVFMQNVVRAKWRAPAAAGHAGPVVFRATVVQDFKTYWKDVVSHEVNIVEKAGEDGGEGVTSEVREPRNSREEREEILPRLTQLEEEGEGGSEGKDRVPRLATEPGSSGVPGLIANMYLYTILLVQM